MRYQIKIIEYKTYLNKLNFKVSGNPKVSIIIPFKDKVNLLKDLVKSIEDKSTYKNYELILVNNRSQEQETIEYLAQSEHKVVNADIDFNFSTLNNLGVDASTGDYLIFINNDMEVITPCWIESMLGLAQLDNVGIVGGKLLYPSDEIQHCGMVKRKSGNVFHINRLLNTNDGGYQDYIQLIREYSILTGAFLMISREKFNKIGKFDENFAVENNDIDLCIKSLKAGYYNLYNPNSVLYHFESISRKGMFQETCCKNYEEIRKKWPDFFSMPDKFYNPNFSEYNYFHTSI